MSGTVMLADVLTVHVNNAWRHKQWCTLNCSPGVLITHCVRVCDFCMSADGERSLAAQRKSVVLSVVCVCVCVSCVGRCIALRWAAVLMVHDSSNFFLTPTEKPKRRSPSLCTSIANYNIWYMNKYTILATQMSFIFFFSLFSQTWKRIISISQAEQSCETSRFDRSIIQPAQLLRTFILKQEIKWTF